MLDETKTTARGRQPPQTHVKLLQSGQKTHRLDDWINDEESREGPGKLTYKNKMDIPSSGIELTDDEVAAAVAVAASGAVVAAVTDGVNQYIPILTKNN